MKRPDLANTFKQISKNGIKAFGKEFDVKEHAHLTKLSRDIKLSLNGDNTNSDIMELIEESERAGSLCTRIMGAGGGGFFICWAPKEKHNEIKNKLKIKTWVNVKFSLSGSQIIFSE